MSLTSGIEWGVVVKWSFDLTGTVSVEWSLGMYVREGAVYKRQGIKSDLEKKDRF